MVKVIVESRAKRIVGVEQQLTVGFYYGAVRGFGQKEPQLFLNTGKGLVFFTGERPSEMGSSPNEQVDVVAVDVELVVTTKV